MENPFKFLLLEKHYLQYCCTQQRKLRQSVSDPSLNHKKVNSLQLIPLLTPMGVLFKQIYPSQDYLILLMCPFARNQHPCVRNQHCLSLPNSCMPFRLLRYFLSNLLAHFQPWRLFQSIRNRDRSTSSTSTSALFP